MINLASVNWFKLNRQLHRDIGYFSIGLTVVFAISGLALNHIRDFNPNYAVNRYEKFVEVSLNEDDSVISKQILSSFNIDDNYKATYWESPKVFKLFFEGGSSLTFFATNNKAVYEEVTHRPILPHLNRLHLNEAKKGWVIFSDFYALFLLYLAISALFMVKGKYKAFGLRRCWLVLSGAAIPLAYILF